MLRPIHPAAPPASLDAEAHDTLATPPADVWNVALSADRFERPLGGATLPTSTARAASPERRDGNVAAAAPCWVQPPTWSLDLHEVPADFLRRFLLYCGEVAERLIFTTAPPNATMCFCDRDTALFLQVHYALLSHLEGARRVDELRLHLARAAPLLEQLDLIVGDHEVPPRLRRQIDAFIRRATTIWTFAATTAEGLVLPCLALALFDLSGWAITDPLDALRAAWLSEARQPTDDDLAALRDHLRAQRAIHLLEWALRLAEPRASVADLLDGMAHPALEVERDVGWLGEVRRACNEATFRDACTELVRSVQIYEAARERLLGALPDPSLPIVLCPKATVELARDVLAAHLRATSVRAAVQCLLERADQKSCAWLSKTSPQAVAVHLAHAQRPKVREGWEDSLDDAQFLRALELQAKLYDAAAALEQQATKVVQRVRQAGDLAGGLAVLDEHLHAEPSFLRRFSAVDDCADALWAAKPPAPLPRLASNFELQSVLRTMTLPDETRQAMIIQASPTARCAAAAVVLDHTLRLCRRDLCLSLLPPQRLIGRLKSFFLLRETWRQASSEEARQKALPQVGKHARLFLNKLSAPTAALPGGDAVDWGIDMLALSHGAPLSCSQLAALAVLQPDLPQARRFQARFSEARRRAASTAVSVAQLPADDPLCRAMSELANSSAALTYLRARQAQRAAALQPQLEVMRRVVGNQNKSVGAAFQDHDAVLRASRHLDEEVVQTLRLTTSATTAGRTSALGAAASFTVVQLQECLLGPGVSERRDTEKLEALSFNAAITLEEKFALGMVASQTVLTCFVQRALKQRMIFMQLGALLPVRYPAIPEAVLAKLAAAHQVATERPGGGALLQHHGALRRQVADLQKRLAAGTTLAERADVLLGMLPRLWVLEDQATELLHQADQLPLHKGTASGAAKAARRARQAASAAARAAAAEQAAAAAAQLAREAEQLRLRQEQDANFQDARHCPITHEPIVEARMIDCNCKTPYFTKHKIIGRCFEAAAIELWAAQSGQLAETCPVCEKQVPVAVSRGDELAQGALDLRELGLPLLP